MKNKIVILSLFTAINLYAGFDDKLKEQFGSAGDFLDSYVNSVIENPTSIKGQTRGLYTLGGARIRMKETGSFRPINLQLGSLKYGCSGIDSVMGSFSYLDPDKLVEKGKAIVAQAPAFAFQMALSMLDKETQSIMQELEKVLQSFNSFQIDSCKASQNLATWAMGKFETGTQQNLANGSSDSYMDLKEDKSYGDIISGWVNQANNFFNGDNTKATKSVKKELMNGSLIELSIANSQLSGLNTNLLGLDPNGDSLLESFTRNLVGDVIGYKLGAGSDFTPQIKHIPMGTQNNIENFIVGGNLNFASYNHNENPIKQEPTIDYGVKNNFKGIKTIFEEKIKAILLQMRSNEKISAENRSFINSLPLPIYNFLNTQSMLGSENDTLLSEYLAIMEAQSFFSMLLGGIGKTIRNEISSNKDENYQKAKEIALNLVKTKEFMDSEFRVVIEKFNSKKTIVDKYKEYQQELENTVGVF
jgi:conjugative transfer pilus assembly protein TraH